MQVYGWRLVTLGAQWIGVPGCQWSAAFALNDRAHVTKPLLIFLTEVEGQGEPPGFRRMPWCLAVKRETGMDRAGCVPPLLEFVAA